MDEAARRALAVLIATALVAAVTALLLQKTPALSPVGASSLRPDVAAAKVEPALPDARPMVVTDQSGSIVSAGSTMTASRRFADLFPAQSRASRQAGVPASNYWALLIGINDYAGGTRDNVGSHQDARDLRKHLGSLGWKSDHIVLLTDRNATASMIVQSIRWLASKTNSASVVVFHYAGHEKPVRSSADGDNERRDIALWASDNKLILDGTLGKELNRVRATKMWLNFAVCRAAGFSDAGTIKSGRVLTYASKESELAYEDPVVKRTVFGWFVVNEGMMQKQGDANRNGDVGVEEAYNYGRPRAIKRASGRQHPVIVDKLSGGLGLRPPPPPPPPSEQQPPNTCIFIVCTPTARREGF